MDEKKKEKGVVEYLKRDDIGIVGSKLLIPYILLFALYVQFHGDFGPGGGFQAGVMFAAAFILHSLVGRIKDTQKAISPMVIEKLIPLGVLVYAGTGIWCMVKGGNFLDYNALNPEHPAHGQHVVFYLLKQESVLPCFLLC